MIVDVFEILDILLEKFLPWLPLELKGLRVQLEFFTIDLHVIRLRIFYAFQLYGKSKSWTFSFYRSKTHFTIKLLNDCVCDYKAKTNAVGVYFVIIASEPKEFEKLSLILLFDSNTGVFNRYLQIWITSIGMSFYLNVNCHLSFSRKFDSVALDPQ